MTILSELKIDDRTVIRPLDRVGVRTHKGVFSFVVSHIIRDESGAGLVSQKGRIIRPGSFPVVSHIRGIL